MGEPVDGRVHLVELLAALDVVRPAVELPLDEAPAGAPPIHRPTREGTER